MKANYISSRQLIEELVNDYNIQSSDFVPRCSIWIKNCIKELGIYQGFTQHKLIGTFGISQLTEVNGIFEYDRESVFGFELPSNFISIERLKLNGIVAREKGRRNQPEKEVFVEQDTSYLENTPDDPCTLFIMMYNQQFKNTNTEDVTYHIEMNYIHTSLENGTFELVYRGIPFETDSIGVQYPFVMDNGLLKKAIKLYILKMILMRGYVHPILSLEKNNMYVNPAMEFDTIRNKVKVSCNKFTLDERKQIEKIMVKMF